MKKFVALAALSASALAMSAGASFADYTLNILHINDWHSRIESNNRFESTCSTEEEGKGECIGGAARLVTAVAQRRKALDGQNMLLLNAGDNFQGSLFYATYKGTVEAEFLNQMKFDAMTVGNHEFDDGEEALVPFLEKVEFPVLSANVHPDAQSKVGDRIKPSIVLEVGGQKIGIVGAVTTDTPEIASPGPHITIEDDIATITSEVEKLTAQGINKIIALTHVGYVRDMEAIAKIPNVDVVVGGHSHTLLSNIAERKPAGPYPTMIDNPGGYKVPVTQAASYSKYLGEFAVTFDDNGVVKEAKGEPLFLDKSIEPDAAVLARIKELGAPIEEMKGKVVSETTAEIDGSRDNCRARECAMGNLVSDAILDRVKGQGVEIVISNGGGLRASINAGEVTMGEVLTVLPFQNTLATFQLTGADLVASLEQGVSEVSEGKGKFPQVAGLRYTFDLNVAPNEGRIKNVEVGKDGAWSPIDPAKLYTIATNNFVRGGGDGYKLFASNAKNAYDFGPSLEQVVADYLAANRPYTPKLDGRITEIAATAPAEEKKADATPAQPAPAAAPAQPAPAATAPAAPAQPAPAPAATAPAAAAPAAGAEVKTPELPKMSSEIANTPPTVAPAPAAPAQPAPAAAAPAQPAPAATAPATPSPAAETAAVPAAPAATTPAAPEKYIIARGDNYWKLAEKFYGDGMKWHDLAKANPGYKARFLPIGEPLEVPAAN